MVYAYIIEPATAHVYTITETGGGGADGGIVLQLTRVGETFLVQCKHWKAYKVSVNVVCELFGVMASQGAAGGLVVSSGVFQPMLAHLLRRSNIELIDRRALKKMFDSVQFSNRTDNSGVGATEPTGAVDPTCPCCGSAMVKRVAKQGAKAGKAFWGCTSYPHCRGVLAIDRSRAGCL